MEYGRSYGLGWRALAPVDAGLAQSKRRSGLNWFFLSLLLGPFATFCIVVCDPLPFDPAKHR